MYTDQPSRVLTVNSLNELEYFDLLQLLKDQASLPKHFKIDDYEHNSKQEEKQSWHQTLAKV